MEDRDDNHGAPKSLTTFSERLPGNVLCLLGALFLGARSVGVFDARVSGPPIFGILQRVFFCFLVGGIAVLVGAVAILDLVGPRRDTTARHKIPASVSVRRGAMDLHNIPASINVFCLCPACGRLAPDVKWCAACEIPLGDRSKGWYRESRSIWSVLLLLCIGAGLVSLGAFVALGPLLEGERRLWAAVGFVALGLMIAGFGPLMLWEGAIVIRDALSWEREREKKSFLRSKSQREYSEPTKYDRRCRHDSDLAVDSRQSNP